MNVQIEESWKQHLAPEFEKDYFFFTYIIEFTIKALRPGLPFVGKFLITDLISLIFSVCSWFGFNRCIFLGLYPFLLGYPLCCHIIVHSSLLRSLVFLSYQVHQFSSVAQSCLTLWDPMDCSTPGFPVCH